MKEENQDGGGEIEEAYISWRQRNPSEALGPWDGFRAAWVHLHPKETPPTPGGRPPFDGADIFRLNRLADQFPQYESSTRWKNLWPFIWWALGMPDNLPDPRKRGGPEALETAEREVFFRSGYKAGYSRGAWSMMQGIGGNIPQSENQAWNAHRQALEAAPASVSEAKPSQDLELEKWANDLHAAMINLAVRIGVIYPPKKETP